MGTTEFHNEPLRDMVAVGAVRAESARIWMRAAGGGRLRIAWHPEDRPAVRGERDVEIEPGNERDDTVAVDLPGERPGSAPLEPLTRYRFSVTASTDGRLVGEGRFETAPADAAQRPRRFSIAFMSCNMPFDADGRLAPRSEMMWRAVRTCLRRHEAKAVLFVGDQMYSDYPPELSLFDPDHFAHVAPPERRTLFECSASEVRRLFHARYRHYWSSPGWRAVLAEYPCYPILDDHDVVDNWGSDPAHQTERWRAFGLGAMQAYFDYQGALVRRRADGLPESFDFSFVYGDAAVYALDLRSNRTGGEDGRLYSAAQWHRLERFLEQTRELPFLFLVLSVPVVHLPRTAARLIARSTSAGEDFSDRWSTGGHIRDRDRLLKRLCRHQREHPRQRLVLLSGDIHIGCVHRIEWDGLGLHFHQMISSGVTHSVSGIVRVLSNLSIRLNKKVSTMDGELSCHVKALRGMPGARHNPYGQLNVGIVELDGDPGARSMRLLLYGHEGDEPVCVYRSPDL